MVPGPHVLIVAGDPSGDEHAAALAQTLRQRQSNLRVTAMGGVHLQQAANHFLYPLVGIGGFGFLEPFMKLPSLWRAWTTYRKLLISDKPDLVIPVDYYGFNIHVARAARKEGIPVAYYVSPQVWASRPHRIQALAKAVSRMLVIFPFETELYRRAGVPVSFVGHPLLARLPPPTLASVPSVLGLLPGSRRAIVERHLSLLLDAADRLHQRFPDLHVQLFRPRELDESLYRAAIGNRAWIELVYDSNYEKRKKLSLAIGVSGTAALENMLLGIPMVIMYRLSSVTYQIAKRLIRIPFVGIPNILAGRAVVPELLQGAATADNIAVVAGNLLADTPARERMRTELLALCATLQADGAVQVADEILRMLSGKNTLLSPIPGRGALA